MSIFLTRSLRNWCAKPLDLEQPSELKRCLSALDLTLLGIGAIIGTGIFVLTGIWRLPPQGLRLCCPS